jgi:hypothetical protein
VVALRTTCLPTLLAKRRKSSSSMRSLRGSLSISGSCGTPNAVCAPSVPLSHAVKELQKEVGDSGSSSSSDPDTDSDLEDPVVDHQIIKTIAMIRSKDKTIYDANFKAFDDPPPSAQDAAEAPNAADKKKKDKAMTVRDYAREQLLSGAADEEEEGGGVVRLQQRERSRSSKLYNEEQVALKRAFLQVGDDPNADDLFAPAARAPEVPPPPLFSSLFLFVSVLEGGWGSRASQLFIAAGACARGGGVPGVQRQEKRPGLLVFIFGRR